MSTLVVTNLSLGAGGLPNGSVLTDDLADNAITTSKIANANITAAKLDGAQSGDAPIYGARAWVNFNGTGTVAIRSSGNVSSITDVATGRYIVNFATAMADAAYCTNVTGTRAQGWGAAIDTTATQPSTTYVAVATTNNSGNIDTVHVCVSIFE